MLDRYLVGFLSFVLLSVSSDWALTECQNWHEDLWAQEEGDSDKIIVCSPKGFLSFWIQKYCLSVLQPQSTSRWDPSSKDTPLDTESWVGKLQECCVFFFAVVQEQHLGRCLQHSYVECWILGLMKRLISFGPSCSALANLAALTLPGQPHNGKERERQYCLLCQVARIPVTTFGFCMTVCFTLGSQCSSKGIPQNILSLEVTNIK